MIYLVTRFIHKTVQVFWHVYSFWYLRSESECHEFYNCRQCTIFEVVNHWNLRWVYDRRLSLLCNDINWKRMLYRFMMGTIYEYIVVEGQWSKAWTDQCTRCIWWNNTYKIPYIQSPGTVLFRGKNKDSFCVIDLFRLCSICLLINNHKFCYCHWQKFLD